MATLEIPYGNVVWRALRAIGDQPSGEPSADPDPYPDVVPFVGGVVAFKPLTPSFVDEHDPKLPVATVIPATVTATIGEDGLLYDPALGKSVWLIAGQYDVSFTLPGAVFPGFRIEVKDTHTAEAPLELALAAPIQPSPAVRFVVNEQVYRDTLAAKDEAIAAADAAVPIAVAAAAAAGESAATAAAGPAVAVAIAAQAGKIVQGTGMPNGVVTATPGTLYVDTASTMGASVWRKATGTGNTGWLVVAGDTGWRDITGMIGPAWKTYLTGSASSRKVTINRVDGFVTLRVLVDSGDAIVGEPRSRSQEFLNLPTGFKNGGYTSVGYGRATPPSAIADFNTGGTIGMIRVFTMGESDSSTWASGHYLTAEFTFKTDNAWPTTLPGSPA